MKPAKTEHAAAAQRRRERWARNGRYRFTIEFATTKCACGASRIRTVACADCGAHPERHDTDVGLQRRKSLSRRALAALKPRDRSQDAKAFVDVSAAFDSLGEALNPFLAALQTFANSKSDTGDRVVEACAHAASLRDELVATPPLRPWVFAQTEAAAIADGLTTTLSTFLLATSAPTPLEAQELGARAQRELDDLGEAGGRVADLFHRVNAITDGDSVASILEACAADAYLTLGASSLPEVDEAAAAQLAPIIGRRPAEGQGLAYMHHDLWVTVLGDRSKFHRGIAQFDRLIGHHPQEFRALLKQPGVLAELQEGMLQMADQLQQTMVTIENARTGRQELRAAVQLMHALYEGPGRRFAALALDLVGKGRFDALLAEDGAHIIGMAQQDKHCRHSFYGFEKSFRVGYAHFDFASTDDGIVVRRRDGSTDTWTVDEILDRLIAMTECIVSLGLVLGMRAEDLGFDLHPPAALEALGLDDSKLVSIALAWTGCTDVEASIINGIPVVRFSAERLTMGALAVVSRGFRNTDLARLEITKADGSTDAWTLDLTGLQRFSESDDEVEKQALLLLALTRSTKNGARAYENDVLAHWAACRTVALLTDGDLQQTMRELTQLVRFADTIEDALLSSAIRRVKAFFRLSAMGNADANTRAESLGINDFLLPEPPDMDELFR